MNSVKRRDEADFLTKVADDYHLLSIFLAIFRTRKHLDLYCLYLIVVLLLPSYILSTTMSIGFGGTINGVISLRNRALRKTSPLLIRKSMFNYYLLLSKLDKSDVLN